MLPQQARICEINGARMFVSTSLQVEPKGMVLLESSKQAQKMPLETQVQMQKYFTQSGNLTE